MKILFFHKSNSSYLPFTLSQVHELNPNSEVILLGDESNNCYSFLTHALIDDYYESASEFEKLYTHRNLVAEWIVRLWFIRWFVFRDYVFNNNIEGDFICLDSDVLVYENLDKVRDNYFDGYDLTVRGRGGAGFQWFRNKEVLDNFCNFIMKQFTQLELITRLDLNWEGHQKINYGGIDDMYALNFYIDEGKFKVMDISIPIQDVVIEKQMLDIKDCISKGEEVIIKFDGCKPYFNKIDGSKYYCIAIHNQNKPLMFKYYVGRRYRRLKFDWACNYYFELFKSKLIIRTRIKRFFS